MKFLLIVALLGSLNCCCLGQKYIPEELRNIFATHVPKFTEVTLKEAITLLLRLYPEYADDLTKIELGGPHVTLMGAQYVHMFYQAFIDGDLCFVKNKMAELKIDFDADDVQKLGFFVVDFIEIKTEGLMTVERIVLWKKLILAIAEEYSKVDNGEYPCEPTKWKP